MKTLTGRRGSESILALFAGEGNFADQRHVYACHIPFNTALNRSG